jgi:hypothetical protein
VADVLHLDGGLPLWAHDHLAAEPLVFDRLVAELTRRNVMVEDLGLRETRLGQHKRGINDGSVIKESFPPRFSRRTK